MRSRVGDLTTFQLIAAVALANAVFATAFFTLGELVQSGPLTAGISLAICLSLFVVARVIER